MGQVEVEQLQNMKITDLRFKDQFFFLCDFSCFKPAKSPWGDKGLQGKSVLDVGCGTGFVGLVASKLGATSVCLSDRPGKSLVLAQLNAEANGKMLPPKGKVEVKALSWGSGKVDEVEKDFEVLLLSEVLYVAQPSCVPWTLDDAELLSLAQLTKSKLTADGEAWVTYGNREAGGGEQFQRAVEAVGLHFEELPLEEILKVLRGSAKFFILRIFLDYWTCWLLHTGTRFLSCPGSMGT